MVLAFFGGGGGAERRLMRTVREQDAEIGRVMESVAQRVSYTLIKQTYRLTGKPNANALFKPNKARRICARLAYVTTAGDLFRWYDKNYGQRGSDYGLAVLRRPPMDEAQRALVCGRVLQHFRTRYLFARWIAQRCDQAGCDAERRTVLSNLEAVLRGSPSAVRAEALARVVSLNAVTLEMYRYIDAVLERMVDGDLSTEEIGHLQDDAAQALAEFYNECCISLQGLADFAWSPTEEPGVWRNAVTGSVASGWEGPRVGIRALSPPAPDAGLCSYTAGKVLAGIQAGCG